MLSISFDGNPMKLHRFVFFFMFVTWIHFIESIIIARYSTQIYLINTEKIEIYRSDFWAQQNTN